MRAQLASIALVALALSPPHPLAAQDTIRAVEIVRHDVFTGAVARRFYGRITNTLHIMTRDGAIRREILLKPGEPYDSALAAEGARNLRHLGVFRLVQVDTVRTDSGLVLRYTTDDGWSTKLDFRFGSTGNQTTWTVGGYEDNLLGTAGQLAFEHRKTPDRSSNTFFFQRSRLIANKVFLRTEYINESDGRVGIVTTGIPWLSTASHVSAMLRTSGADERILQFRSGDPLPADSVRRIQTILRGDFGWAPFATPRQYLRLGLTTQLRRDDVTPWAGPNTTPHTVTGDVQAWTEFSRVRFQVLQGFRSFAAQEDIDLSFTIRLGAALAPAAWGYPQTGTGPLFAVHGGAELGPTAFVTGDFRYNSLYSSGGLDSGSIHMSGTIGWVAGARHVFVTHLEGGWKANPTPGDEFDLGLGLGPRAFGAHSFTGDREFHATVEYRFTLAPDLWGLTGLGLAGFVDHGGAWFSGEARRTGSDAGVGLRIGPSRATSIALNRLDLAYRFKTDRQAAGWVFVVGKGYTF